MADFFAIVCPCFGRNKNKETSDLESGNGGHLQSENEPLLQHDQETAKSSFDRKADRKAPSIGPPRVDSSTSAVAYTETHTAEDDDTSAERKKVSSAIANGTAAARKSTTSPVADAPAPRKSRPSGAAQSPVPAAIVLDESVSSSSAASGVASRTPVAIMPDETMSCADEAAAAKNSANKRKSSPAPSRSAVITKSCYEAIQAYTLEYTNLETGGDLFGVWGPDQLPQVLAVTGPGPKARRSSVTFYQDTDYLEQRAVEYAKCGWVHLGGWHSHHTMCLPHPSGGDSNSARVALQKTGMPQIFVVIVTIEEYSEAVVHPFLFTNKQPSYIPLQWQITPDPYVSLPGGTLQDDGSQQWYRSAKGKEMVKMLNVKLSDFSNVKISMDKSTGNLELELTPLPFSPGRRAIAVVSFPASFPKTPAQALVALDQNTQTTVTVMCKDGKDMFTPDLFVAAVKKLCIWTKK